MDRQQHIKMAEQLLAEGRQVVSQIRIIQPGEQDWRERRVDLGKQARGIWAQAQVHTTLALTLAVGREPEDAASRTEASIELVMQALQAGLPVEEDSFFTVAARQRLAHGQPATRLS